MCITNKERLKRPNSQFGEEKWREAHDSLKKIK